MSAATVSPVPDDVFAALGAFIQTVLGTGIPVIRGIDNEVPMPAASPGFVNMTALFQIPLATNQDTWDETNAAPTEFSVERDTRIDIQMDCYGAASGSWAAMLSTLLRDQYGCAQLAPNCQPLYAEDARMLPLEDGEDQYEERWAVTAAIQYNPVTVLPMQFADTLDVGLINVDVVYPAT